MISLFSPAEKRSSQHRAFRDTTVKMGQASALSVVLALIIIAVTFIQRRVIEGSGSTTE